MGSNASVKQVFCLRGKNLLLADMRGGHQLLDEVIQTHFSLLDESCGWREEANVKPLPHSPGDEMLSRTKTKISALDWLICPFWLSTSCSRGDLRVAHRALMLRAYGLCNPATHPATSSAGQRSPFPPITAIIIILRAVQQSTPRLDSVYTEMRNYVAR